MIKEGIINIKKPTGCTSHDCVNVIRSLTGVKRIGHTGTLDPMASGVLPICIGTAARITEYLDLDLKRYCCEVLLGVETDTLDIWGEILVDNRSKALQLIETGQISEKSIQSALELFTGTITQVPPKYSALKVKGRKLYEYARAGQEVEIASRQVYVEQIQLTQVSLQEGKFVLDIVCSKGTYIRSICRDLGVALGCGAVMSGLIRTASGAFSIEDAISLDTLKGLKQGEDIRDAKTGRITKYARALPEDLNLYVTSPDFPLVHFGKMILDEHRVKWFCDGGYVDLCHVTVEKEPAFKEKPAHIPMREAFKEAYNAFCIADGKALFLGVAFYNKETKQFKADKVFDRG